MNKQLHIRSAVLAALLAGWGASGVALAGDEVEPNQPVGSAQHLVFGSDRSVQVNGFMGPDRDVDFYSFDATENDVVSIDIDGGSRADGTGLDSIVAIFGPKGGDPLYRWDHNDDVLSPGTVDPGSANRFDARIDNFHVQTSGRYVVGVSSAPGDFIDVNTLSTGRVGSTSNGAYTLIISGVTPSIQQISIIIKPGSNEVAPVNPKAQGNVPVALLSSKEFDAAQIDQGSLRFGAQGDEASLLRCNKDATDVNADGLPDLVCHFDNRVAAFDVGDTAGIVTGATTGGRLFEGRGWLKVVGGKRR